MCFGGGGSQTSNSVAEFKPPGYTQQGWQDYLTGAQQLSQRPYQQYMGQKVAGINGQQYQAQQFGTDRALYGAPDLNAGRGAATDVASGMYFNNSPWTNAAYTNNVIQDNANTMTNAFNHTTQPQTAAAYALGGAYGGSNYNQAQAANESALQNQIGQMANQYQLQNAQMGNSNYNQGIGQMLQAGQLGGQLSQDDWTAAQALMGYGNQNQQYAQNLMNSNYQDWQNMVNYPSQQLQQYGNALSQASGQGGQSATTTYGPPTNWATGLLGAGSAAYGLFGGGS
jgi:hypothetical protein